MMKDDAASRDDVVTALAGYARLFRLGHDDEHLGQLVRPISTLVDDIERLHAIDVGGAEMAVTIAVPHD